MREAILFDLSPAESADTLALTGQRVAALDHAPLLLGTTHLVCGLMLALVCNGAVPLSGMNSVLAPFLGVLLLDAAVGVLVHVRNRFELAPHVVVRLFCGYLAAAALLWVLFMAAVVETDPVIHAGYLAVAAGCVAIAASVVAVASPALAIASAMAIVAQVVFFVPQPLTIVAAASGAFGISLYSVIGTQTMLASAYRRLRLDQEAHKSLQFVQEFEQSGRGWFWETNANGTLSYVSQQLADDFNCHPSQLLGRQFTDLLFVDRGAALDSLREERTLGFHLSARFPFSDVTVRAAIDGDIWWSLSGNPIFDELGRFLGFRGIGTDLSEQRRSEQEISRLARFDSLTGLPNRAAMRQTLDEALRNSTSRKKGCALFLIDLDRFKNVNDTLGHPVGDALLRQVAQRLGKVMGNHGQIGRLGGDEFQAVLPGIVEAGFLERLAQELIGHVSAPYVVEGHRVTIGASVGIAIADVGRVCADSLVRNADLALYAAKEAGRGKHCFYEPSMHSEASDRQLLENDLRQAIERDELHLVYQPVVRAESEELTGFEALLRWNHPKRGSVSPAKFIPVAEECGLIGPIGEWVLRTAAAEAASWPKGMRVAVNLSPIQFNNPAVVSLVENVLRATSLEPASLELEITEGVFLADSDQTDVTFAKLKKLGVRLALDDFGTGYSSLGYLKKAPFDKIKIDQSFVRGASSTSSRNSAIIRAIVTLAESLGMDTTAEGVESHDDLHLIRELGCSHVQGYIFGKPMPAEAARVLTESTRVEADGFETMRAPRQRLMRRALIGINGMPVEIRLRNISTSGAMAESDVSIAPGTEITIDIVGAGPVVGIVRWAQEGRFGIQFADTFDLRRLTPKKEPVNTGATLRPAYLDWYQQEIASHN